MNLTSRSLPELETLYARAPIAPLAGGVWRGRYLHELPMSPSERLLCRAMFKWRTFGVDLDQCGWWFGRPGRIVGRFETKVGTSRWRETEVVRLDYRRTTPWPLRRLLYDELKPLSYNAILGLGGVNRSGPRGAWFYFALERMP